MPYQNDEGAKVRDDLPPDPYDALIEEGNLALIDKLARAAKGEPGYQTVIVPRKGFSNNDRTHNRVIRWMKAYNIHYLDLIHEVENMKRALHEGIKANKLYIRKMKGNPSPLPIIT